MTNFQIVETIKATEGITEDLFTFMEWKFKGYKVKKGEKAMVQTKLWKRVSSKAKEETDEEEQSGFVLVKASLFGRSQVEKVEGIS